MPSLKEKLQKIKLFYSYSQNRDRVIIPTMVFLVGIASFGIGRLSAMESQKEPVKITTNGSFQTESLSANVSESLEGSNIEGEIELKKGGFVVASKSGTKYHFPWCSGAKRILEENKITFESIEEAKKAGLEPAGNCKGLK